MNGPRDRAKRATSVAQRLVAALQEGVGQPGGRHRAERVAVAARVLGGDQPLLAGHPDEHRSPLAYKSGLQALCRIRQVANLLVFVARRAIRPVCADRRATGLDLLERARVDQVAQLLLAEQLAQQVAVERQRLGAPLGGRRVVLVHVGGDVVEEERGAIRRGGRRLDVDEVDLRASAGPGAALFSAGRSKTSWRHSR